MKRSCTKAIVAAFLALGGGAAVIPAAAAPPTVTPSPGYDARLQERRAAGTVSTPVAPLSKPVTPRRTRRTHAH